MTTMKKKSYIVITDKREQLPWAVLDDTKQAAKWLSMSRDGVNKAIKRESVIWDMYRVFRVDQC